MNKKASLKIKTQEVDRENRRVRFVFSSSKVDRHNEVIDQNGWKLDSYNQNPVVLWGHDQSRFPIAKAEDLQVIDGKLEGWVKFAYDENPEAAVAFELVAGGYLSAGSVGFMNLKWMYDEEADLLTLLENELYEFSIVNVPANPEALRKAYDDLKAKNVNKGITDRIKEMQKADDQRFKNLGEQVQAKPKEGVKSETPNETKAKPDTDLVAEAIETIIKTGPTKIQEAVASLRENLKDVDKKGKVEKTPEAPQDHTKRKYSNDEINRAIRSLIKGSK